MFNVIWRRYSGAMRRATPEKMFSVVDARQLGLYKKVAQNELFVARSTKSSISQKTL